MNMRLVVTFAAAFVHTSSSQKVVDSLAAVGESTPTPQPLPLVQEATLFNLVSEFDFNANHESFLPADWHTVAQKQWEERDMLADSWSNAKARNQTRTSWSNAKARNQNRTTRGIIDDVVNKIPFCDLVDHPDGPYLTHTHRQRDRKSILGTGGVEVQCGLKVPYFGGKKCTANLFVAPCASPAAASVEIDLVGLVKWSYYVTADGARHMVSIPGMSVKVPVIGTCGAYLAYKVSGNAASFQMEFEIDACCLVKPPFLKAKTMCGSSIPYQDLLPFQIIKKTVALGICDRPKAPSSSSCSSGCEPGYFLIAKDVYCSLHNPFVAIGGPNWPVGSTAAESKTACAGKCNDRSGCTHYTWFSDRGCRTYSSCNALTAGYAGVEEYVCQKALPDHPNKQIVNCAFGSSKNSDGQCEGVSPTTRPGLCDWDFKDYPRVSTTWMQCAQYCIEANNCEAFSYGPMIGCRITDCTVHGKCATAGYCPLVDYAHIPNQKMYTLTTSGPFMTAQQAAGFLKAGDESETDSAVAASSATPEPNHKHEQDLYPILVAVLVLAAVSLLSNIVLVLRGWNSAQPIANNADAAAPAGERRFNGSFDGEQMRKFSQADDFSSPRFSVSNI